MSSNRNNRLYKEYITKCKAKQNKESRLKHDSEYYFRLMAKTSIVLTNPTIQEAIEQIQLAIAKRLDLSIKFLEILKEINQYLNTISNKQIRIADLLGSKMADYCVEALKNKVKNIHSKTNI